MRMPTLRRRRPAPNPAIIATASLHSCPRCHHTAYVADDLWLTILDTRTGQQLATVCSPRCGVLWLEATYRPAELGVAL